MDKCFQSITRSFAAYQGLWGGLRTRLDSRTARRHFLCTRSGLRLGNPHTVQDDRMDRENFLPIEYHTVTLGEKTEAVAKFNIMEGWVSSFHHSLHWLLAELFKHGSLLSEEMFKPCGYLSLIEVIKIRTGPRGALTAIEFPLRGKADSTIATEFLTD